MRRTAALVLALGMTATAGLGACGDTGPDGPAGSATPATEDTSIPLPSRAALTFVVEDPAGTDVLTVDLAPDGSGRVRGDLGVPVDLEAGPLDGGRRSWRTAGQPLGEARLEDSGKLKLKAPTGEALWVVKPSDPERSKVLEGEDAEIYSLQTRAGGEAKVKQGDAEAGAVKSRSSGGAKVERPDGTTLFQSDLASTPGLGLLLMTRIPAPQRAVLLVELVDRAQP